MILLQSCKLVDRRSMNLWRIWLVKKRSLTNFLNRGLEAKNEMQNVELEFSQNFVKSFYLVKG